MMKKAAAVLVLVWCTAVSAGAQDAELASQYFRNGEFDKAVVLYEKLWTKTPASTQYFQHYVTCLEELKQYNEAEKVIRRQIRKFPEDLSYYADLGHIFHQQGDSKSETAAYEESVRLITPNMQQINKLANRYLGYGQTDYAIKSYLKGRKVFNADGSGPFASDLFLSELAMIYRRTGDAAHTIQCYLDILAFNPSQKEYVEGQLQSLIELEAYARELQTELYRRIQKQPDNEDLSDLLVWYFIQKKDFSSAFQQVKALDKRNKEDGNRVFAFAQSARDEGYYDVAISAYRYLITEKGKNSYLYLPARSSELSTEKTRLTIRHDYTTAALLELESKYESFLAEFGRSPQTLTVLRDYAALEARFLHNIDRAIALLQEAIEIPTSDRRLNGYLRLDLGDAWLIKNEVWESMLLYGQVDKAFKEDALGEEARYKNARLSFYMGDFEWSQTQLDVLKSATSELVANDALALSVFITDNMGLDTTPEPMRMYARADLLIFQNKYDAALMQLDSIQRFYMMHPLNDDVLFQKGRIYLARQQFTQAAEIFSRIDANYSFDLLADDALFELAGLYEKYLNDPEKAKELYKEILTKYKGSIYTVEARKRFRELRGDTVN